MKKKNALILADTRVALVGNVLLQVKDTNAGLFDEIIIYHQGISDADKALMESILPCRFTEYKPPLPDYIFNEPRFKHFTVMMFCRYEMFRYLDEFETVTWLDTDIIIQGNLDGIIKAAKSTGFAILSEDPNNKTSDSYDCMRTCFTQPLLEYDMDRYLHATGTICISDKLKAGEGYINWCYKKTVEWAEILDLPDQGVINAFIQEFNIKVTPINGSTYARYPSYGRDCSSAVIIHAWGNNKFWNDWYLYTKYPAWRKYHELWLSKGGSPLGGLNFAPKISVLIPVFKPELKWLKQALESLIYQKRSDWERFSDFEIILVAEPFDMKDVKYLVDSLDDPRITLVFNEKRLGISASLNKGGKLAKGSYIARIDADDIANEYRLFKQSRYLDENNSIHMCVSHFNYFGDMNEHLTIFDGEMSRAWSIFTCPFDHPTIMYRKAFFVDNSLFYDETRTHAEDWELWVRAFEKGMNVGCVQDTLTYHRWHTSNAGQSTKTAEAMFDLVAKNFGKLGVTVPAGLLGAVAPWQGRVDEETLSRIEKIFEEALNKNKRLKLYSQRCLEKAFALRIAEAKTGVISEIRTVIETAQAQAENTAGADTVEVNAVPQTFKPRKANIFKRLVKRIITPLYRPFRHRYEDRLIRIENSIWRLRENMNSVSEATNASLMSRLENIRRESIAANAELIEAVTNANAELVANANIELIRAVTSANAELVANANTELIKAVINANAELVANANIELIKAVTNANVGLVANTNAEVRVSIESLHNSLNKNLEAVNENINSLFKQMFEHVSTAADNNFNRSASELGDRLNRISCAIDRQSSVASRVEDEIHRHIDFTYRDIMVVLERQLSFVQKKNVILKTDHPVAYKSNDHIVPHGTVRDNTRYPRFIRKCESIFNGIEALSFLDLGCSGGGMVLEGLLRGHFSIGLEGSDRSLLQQRAEWRLLPDNLKTCDITQPFSIIDGDSGGVLKFNVITAWEVLEHIKEEDLPQTLKNIGEHLSGDGIFVGSIANWDDIDAATRVNWHVTTQPYGWWEDMFKANGFTVHSEYISTIDMARGGYNPPQCYESLYPDADTDKCFHIVAKRK